MFRIALVSFAKKENRLRSDGSKPKNFRFPSLPFCFSFASFPSRFFAGCDASEGDRVKRA